MQCHIFLIYTPFIYTGLFQNGAGAGAAYGSYWSAGDGAAVATSAPHPPPAGGDTSSGPLFQPPTPIKQRYSGADLNSRYERAADLNSRYEQPSSPLF